MPAEYRILYFPIRGFAEELRLFLEEKNISYTDETFDDWMAVKPSLVPLHQVPIAWHGDIKMSQSKAILRYMANKHGANGKNAREALQADIVAEATNDWRRKYAVLCYNPEFDNLKTAYIEETIPFYLKAFEYYLEENGNTGYFAGSDFTYADVCVFDNIDNNLQADPNALDKEQYPKLHKFYHDFKSRPRIAAYLESERRPKYIYWQGAHISAYKNDA
ncbi:glutathione S-transferase [Basidiobolus meristosporus CBS 931.73]|uniref:glutathione transferase n=1 Tax=Basidiobolus meristosporus CBS 931.73 TaxID=1314790 RepID=A0A1Y1YKU2_9FUNG|nr:glutathione S-transferase [Basidiobolus meristosporus CBS 931.73]|eukprot:ORX98647.1 glutathione S-transferase [Basidiobolus meristosporus CBS 931.73]